ncbi:MAG: hypothetical protein ACAI43_20140 [Phycisphaerae bacterium]|nr:hypothetical protein [Tepidisphaeraceae bacterium]
MNERPRDLGPRPVGTPYVIGGIVMMVSAGINIVHAYLAPRVNPVPQGMGYSPGFSLTGMFFYLALGVGLLAGTPIARVVSLILMGILAAMIAGHAFNDRAMPLAVRPQAQWPAVAETKAAAASASGVRLVAAAPAVVWQASEIIPARQPMLPHGQWPLFAAAGGLIVGWALMLTPPPVGVKSYVGAGLVLGAHGLALWGLYF